MLPRLLLRPLLFALAIALCACSAIELGERMAQETAAAEPAIFAKATGAAWQSTAQGLAASATDAAATMAALEAAIPTEPATVEPPALPGINAVQYARYGSVPLDSDRLDTIAALAFDQAGNLLVATRAGAVYRLVDADSDGAAEASQLIFADENEHLRQVAGMFMRGERLIVLNGGRLSQLSDSDGDGQYDTVERLEHRLPLVETPLLASNGIARAEDGRLFTADISTGEILLLQLES